jgi:hypothetical protein
LRVAQVGSRRLRWRQFAALVAMFAFALNVAIGPLCHGDSSAVDPWGQAICAHHDDQGSGGQDQLPFGHPDDDGLCCACCCTTAMDATAAPQSLPLPTFVEWKRPIVLSAELILPRPPRHLVESPRGPPLA